MDRSKTDDEIKELMIKRGLDPDSEVNRAARYTLSSTKHLRKKARRASAKVYGRNFDHLTKQALQLSETIDTLESNYRNCLLYYLSGQCGIEINNSKQISHFIQSLAKAAQSVKRIQLDPIPEGYYNWFLFILVDHLLSTSFRLTYIEFSIFKKAKPTKEIIKKVLYKAWKRMYLKDVRKTSKLIIQADLCTWEIDEKSSEKVIDRHLNRIVDKLVDARADFLVRCHLS